MEKSTVWALTNPDVPITLAGLVIPAAKRVGPCGTQPTFSRDHQFLFLPIALPNTTTTLPELIDN